MNKIEEYQKLLDICIENNEDADVTRKEKIDLFRSINLIKAGKQEEEKKWRKMFEDYNEKLIELQPCGCVCCMHWKHRIDKLSKEVLGE